MSEPGKTETRVDAVSVAQLCDELRHEIDLLTPKEWLLSLAYEPTKPMPPEVYLSLMKQYADYRLGPIVNRIKAQSSYAPSAPRWISVEERLPEVGQLVLVSNPKWSNADCKVMTAHLDAAGWCGHYANIKDCEVGQFVVGLPTEDPTDWQPLPAPPAASATGTEKE